MTPALTRRRFVGLLPGLALSGVALARPGLRRIPAVRLDHPTPRPGITAEHVLKAEQLHNPAAAPIFDLVRAIPEVVDGIRCHCGCADWSGYYSLLSCYEGDGMAQHCEICQGQGKLAHKLHGQGWSLNGIRAAIDAAYENPR